MPEHPHYRRTQPVRNVCKLQRLHIDERQFQRHKSTIANLLSVCKVESGIATGYSATMNGSPKLFNVLPDVRDGLNRKERVVLYCLMQTQKEVSDGYVRTITLYGRVLEHIHIDQVEFQHILAKMTGLTRSSNDLSRS